MLRRLLLFLLPGVLAWCAPVSFAAEPARRVVILKVDGLPQWSLDRAVAERDARTGKSSLPWIDYVFYQHGTRFSRFFVRGISLSTPSWSILDTGRHMMIRGNVEFDRYTLRPYDYLNFFPFYVGYARKQTVDMPSVEVIDDCGIPLLADHFPYAQRYQGMQLFQRGVSWTTLRRGVEHKIRSLTFGLVLEEVNTGFELGAAVTTQAERELIRELSDPDVRYLDYFTGEFDHVAHGTRERLAQRRSLEELDALVGRVWSAIRRSPFPDQTLLVMVSDHGMNTDEKLYSQGFNLVDVFTGPAGGGHHVVTNRYPLQNFKLKGLDPFVNTVFTASPAATYLRDQSKEYPTVTLDLDGNERAAVSLRNSDLNQLHLLLTGVKDRETGALLHSAMANAAMELIDRHRVEWQRKADELEQELVAVGHARQRLEDEIAALPRSWSKQQVENGEDKQERRKRVRLGEMDSNEKSYAAYLHTLRMLLALTPAQVTERAFHIPDVIAPRAMGDLNRPGQLQNYVVGWGERGPLLDANGDLDSSASFRRIDYLQLLDGLRVRNAPQPEAGNRPIDFVAVVIPPSALAWMPEGERPIDGAIWLAQGRGGALLLVRGDRLRYLPVANLRETSEGEVRFDPQPWRAGLPLEVFEDPSFHPLGAERERWLAGWHTEEEWLDASAEGRYPNAVPSLREQLLLTTPKALRDDAPNLAEEERLVRRFQMRTRRLVATDLLVFARSQWNFNVRNPNPGGNHGSLLRRSMHSVWMMSGGPAPQGMDVRTPYDSLRFAPTILHLSGQGDCQGEVLDALPVTELTHQGCGPARTGID